MTTYEKYETVIGLEIHAQMSTKSKAFCGDSATFGGDPNTHISPISLAHPGTLPRANKKHIENAVKLGLATDCTINQVNYFDRKNYFYPDLPKGFQTTQDNQPVCVAGNVAIKVNGTIRNIRLNRIHMEEDAGKSIHDLAPNFSMIDLNRAGVPLLEIVSEPDLRSAEEAGIFVANVRQLVRYLEVSDGNMEEGSLRCDCNISVRLKGETEYGTRCEIKNVNSISNVRLSIAAEAKRQIDMIERGETIIQQTRTFDTVKGITLALRSKEDAHDYRYFPEPDLPPIVISDEELATIKANLPALPKVLFERLTTEFGLSEYDATIIVEDKPMALYYIELAKHTTNYKAAANWLINTIRFYLNEKNESIIDFPVSPQGIAALITLIDTDKLGNLAAKKNVFPALVKSPDRAPLEIAKSLNLIQEDDEDFITTIVKDVLSKYEKEVTEYKKLPNSSKGKKRKKGLISLFVGKVMQASRGKANPKIATGTIMKIIENG